MIREKQGAVVANSRVLVEPNCSPHIGHLPCKSRLGHQYHEWKGEGGLA